MNFSEYFYQNWLDKLVTLLGVLVGVVTAVGIVLSKVIDVIKRLKESTELVAEKQKLLEECKEISQNITSEVGAILENLKVTNCENQKILEQSNQLKESLEERLDSLKKALFIALVNSKDLVKQGYAEQIAELIGDKNEIENE